MESERDGNFYIGSTKDLEKRISEHERGWVKSTAYRRPLKFFGYREFSTIEEAAGWEKKYKKSHGQLERDIKNGKIILK